MNSYQTKNGFINLNQNTFQLYKSADKSLAAKSWFLHQGELYLFKAYPEMDQAYFEVFTSKLAQKLNFPTAEYHLATYNNQYGVISKNFNQTNDKLISLYDILEIYKNQKKLPYLTNSLNNLENIQEALYFVTQNEENTNQNILEIKKIQQLQFLSGDIDRRPKNILFFQNPKLQIVPNFDYGGSFTINLKNDFTIPYALGTNFNGTQFFSPEETISNLLKNPEDNYDLIKNCQITLNATIPILKEIEQESNQEIPKDIKDFIIKIIQNNTQTIQELNQKLNQKGPTR